jgi:hypothetical protein
MTTQQAEMDDRSNRTELSKASMAILIGVIVFVGIVLLIGCNYQRIQQRRTSRRSRRHDDAYGKRHTTQTYFKQPHIIATNPTMKTSNMSKEQEDDQVIKEHDKPPLSSYRLIQPQTQQLQPYHLSYGQDMKPQRQLRLTKCDDSDDDITIPTVNLSSSIFVTRPNYHHQEKDDNEKGKEEDCSCKSDTSHGRSSSRVSLFKGDTSQFWETLANHNENGSSDSDNGSSSIHRGQDHEDHAIRHGNEDENEIIFVPING